MQQLIPDPIPISRNDAYKLGRSRFYTGRACIHGHIAERYVSCGACILCMRGQAKSYARGKNGADVNITVRVHKDDAEAVRVHAAALNAARDVAAVAAFDADKTRARLFPALANAPADYNPPKPVLR